ncbi:triosephosphate isomerase [Helicobacter aurati]|uniref:Triosephosphate isomerase n=1 Tax=Helicobacter aurati TaxID=137778 RepID=A0A3D8J866_9HELI|nr:triose-phosphate isomerase family protein [Helicobacter aurati]RDU73699.1 triosephosphate isomerase [Helicobacter aurati]
MKVIAANFKAYHTPSSTQKYLYALETHLAKSHYLQNEIVVFPNMASLSANNFCYFHIGAQNIYPAANGAFTGEIGLEVLDSLGINHVLLGHSERRRLLGESVAFIQEKFHFCANAHKKIILCIGEDSLLFGLWDKLESFFQQQLQGINLDYPFLYIAYEPLWAIGSKQVATLEYILRVREILRSMGVKICLYGGSVSTTNAKEICAVTDGILVGSASLESSNFADIIRCVC